MAPLMSLSRDDIVDTSLLELLGEECKTSPTPEEEAALLGRNLSHQKPQRLQQPSQNVWRPLGL